MHMMNEIIYFFSWRKIMKELILCHKLWFSNPNIFAIECSRPYIFQPINSVRSNRLKYQRFTQILRLENLSLWQRFNSFLNEFRVSIQSKLKNRCFACSSVHKWMLCELYFKHVHAICIDGEGLLAKMNNDLWQVGWGWIELVLLWRFRINTFNLLM